MGAVFPGKPRVCGIFRPDRVAPIARYGVDTDDFPGAGADVCAPRFLSAVFGDGSGREPFSDVATSLVKQR